MLNGVQIVKSPLSAVMNNISSQNLMDKAKDAKALEIAQKKSGKAVRVL